ncbi:MAG TPA: GDSL-type esterase/lipase family protein [Planctomycetota bacterium]|nr:GDSL-type esterase/lipase family protein [Planctomycetota bacterium]
MLVAIVLAAVCAAAWGAEQAASLVAPYVFTDGQAAIRVPDTGLEIHYVVRTITADGWGPKSDGKVKAENGRILIAPLTEGIHIVTLGLARPVEVRFLAIAPPPAAEKTALVKTLTRTGKKLAAGEKYTILAMGDSVTNTGDFEGMLAMMLSRAFTNNNITVIDRSYPGRSVDAAVRAFEDDAIPNKPDLGLLMYGLNDQAGGVPLDGYLEQYQFIAERMAADCGGDTVFMMPTPHISIPLDDEARNRPGAEPVWFAFRTIGFAESLRPLAARLRVPLADTFAAIWGKGGATIEESVRNMWPKYPLGYHLQMSSMLESDGKGDTIHTNALGHLAMAKAAFDAIIGRRTFPPLALYGSSKWTVRGVVSTIIVRNITAEKREGKLHVYPLMESEIAAADDGPISYNLKPDEIKEFEVSWLQLTRPADLLKHPLNRYYAVGPLMVPVVDFFGGGSRVYCVPLPFEVDTRFVRGRHVCEKPQLDVSLINGAGETFRTASIPDGAEMGRVVITAHAARKGETGHAVAEVAFLRFGGALAGEANIDGDLAEWDDHTWSTVGEPVQARWVQGVADNRAAPSECYLRWAFKAGKAGIFIAVKATGDVRKDRFVLFFDSRSPDLLGTPGRYYWVGGSLVENGVIGLGPGETTKLAPGIKGAWKATDAGADLEMFVPYELMELTEWPRTRDLGLSIWWTHTGPGGATHIMWSEDGHPWNTRWYGVVRLLKHARERLPYMVRVK